MFAAKTHSRFRGAIFQVLVVVLVVGQKISASGQFSSQAPPASALNSIAFDGFVDSTIRQEHRVINLMRYYRPIVETYIQEEKSDPVLNTRPKADDYFLTRLDLTGKAPADLQFEKRVSLKWRVEKKLSQRAQTFAALTFAEELFPDLDHFDRQNYTFEFARWEVLGEVRCAVFDVKPRENSSNAFIGRIWVEDQDFNIVRFAGTHTSKGRSGRAFHFDSWRLNTVGNVWMPAYVYTEELNPHESSSHGLWFKAQTRIWGYDLQNAGHHREVAKPLTDTPRWVDPNRHEASQDLNPEYTVGETTYTPEDAFVERLQIAGLMAADSELDHILQTVANNLLVTNDLDIAGVRCHVLLTTPLESFVVGRTIVVSRGLLDVLPDEATLAAVLAHELAHIVLRHSLGAEYLSGRPFADLEIFDKLKFRFDAAEEAEADKKGFELFSKSPYKDQLRNVALFLQALEAHSAQLPNLLHGRFSNDFSSSHLVGMEALSNFPKQLQRDEVNQIAALPLGSRIKVDPWSDRIEILNRKPVHLASAREKMPFEVSPFFPYLKRLRENAKGADHSDESR